MELLDIVLNDTMTIKGRRSNPALAPSEGGDVPGTPGTLATGVPCRRVSPRNMTDRIAETGRRFAASSIIFVKPAVDVQEGDDLYLTSMGTQKFEVSFVYDRPGGLALIKEVFVSKGEN